MTSHGAPLPNRPTEAARDARAADERALVARIRSGEQAAFEVMFRRYYEPLWRFVVGYVESPEVARELVHDVFFRVWERRERWDLATSLSAYLYSAARNTALNHLRRARQEGLWAQATARAVEDAERDDSVAAVADVALLGGPAAGVDDGVVAREEVAALRRAVAQLPERQRQALVLRSFHGLTHPEVAVVLGVSVKAVESLMVRALASLRKRLANLR
jgi:RNA polymerase sigma-70 factor (ECF subfamily)